MSLCPFGHHKLIIYLFSIQLSDVVLVLLSKIRSTSDLRLRSKTTGSILGIIFKIFCNSKGSGYTSNSYKLLLRTYLFLKMPRSIIVGCGILNYLQKQIFYSQFFPYINHPSYALFTQIYNIFCPQRCVEYVEISLPASLPFWIVRSLSIHPEPQSKQYSLNEPRYFRQHFIRPMLNFNAPILLKSKPFLILY